MLKFQKFTSIEEFLRIVQEIKNQLAPLGEKVPIKTLK